MTNMYDDIAVSKAWPPVHGTVYIMDSLLYMRSLLVM